MNTTNENSKLIFAGIVGGVAGLLLGAYIWSKNNEKNPISSKLKTIARAIEQLEDMDTDEANSLKDELKKLLLNLNAQYGKSEE